MVTTAKFHTGLPEQIVIALIYFRRFQVMETT